jgi:hypothetical protein
VTFASVPFKELVQALGPAAVVTDRAVLDQRSHDSWRMLDARGVLAQEPHLNPRGLIGGVSRG